MARRLMRANACEKQVFSLEVWKISVVESLKFNAPDVGR